ncbi:hypothetical protein N0V82_006491 [Gnomoniopsis sp. IMI 355080]|nr:hypothetical protein N0V82_006491 [Gnomoniopsis sp. IMI 355080]
MTSVASGSARRTLASWLSSWWESLETSILTRELPHRLQDALPPILTPYFTWRPTLLGERPIIRDQEMPRPTSSALPPLVLRLIGRFHCLLQAFSRYYCAWFGLPYRPWMAELPFGLLLKWSDGTSISEVQTMRAVRAAGFPAPRVISYGSHPDTPYAPVSILMTRLPGVELAEVFEEDDGLEDGQRETITEELRVMLDAMRSWTAAPTTIKPISSITGGPIRSIRVANHTLGPFDDERQFTEYLLAPASAHSYDSTESFERDLAMAKRLLNMPPHRIVFTHGDYALHNILVHEGRVTGWIDWESAGWYPEYWEFTTPLRWASTRPVWRGLLMWLGGAQYEAELESELAIRSLTVDAWAW